MFFKFNAPMSDQANDVLNAAALLDTSEFNIFSIAYESWFGEQANEQHLEKHYTAYMFDAVVPHWVRDFSRKIAQLAKSGSLDSSEYVTPEPTASPQATEFARRFVITLAVITFFLFVSANSGIEAFNFTKECFFPPCY